MDYYRTNEYPETYRRCKAYTESFQKWLLKTAISRSIGIEKIVPDHEGDALEPDGRKKYIMPLHSIVPLARMIADSSEPLDDTSGLLDLSDAIRSRKEINWFFRVKNEGDEGHPFFVSKLVEVKDIFRSRSVKHARDKDTSVNVNAFPTGKLDQASNLQDDETDLEATEPPAEASTSGSPSSRRRRSERVVKPPVNKKGKVLSNPQDLKSEQDFQVLCFLYDFSQLRIRIQTAWTDYGLGKISLVHAAQLSDLAQAIAQRNVDVLVADLKDIIPERTLYDIVADLFDTLKPEPQPGVPVNESKEMLSEDTHSRVGRLLCLASIYCMIGFEDPAAEQLAINEGLIFPYIKLFLPYFQRFQGGKFTAPMLDTFTAAMQTEGNGTNYWLPFGFQILIDIQNTLGHDMKRVIHDITDGMICIAHHMQAHCDYEQEMHDRGLKVDYMASDDSLITDRFLGPIASITQWLEQVSNYQPYEHQRYEPHGLEFAMINPIMSGLAKYYHEYIYRTYSIRQVQWFVVLICHLYNACRQVGGLSVEWPDLEHIIKMQEVTSLFVGGRPTNPRDFYRRLKLSLGFASDKQNSKWVFASKEVRSKRGLHSLSPLEQKISDYFYHNCEDERSTRLHNLFAYIHQTEPTKGGNNGDEQTNMVRDEFIYLANAIGSKQRGNNRQKKSKFKTPKFSSEPYAYADSLDRMKEKLLSYELHGKFDYLAWYRRAFGFIMEIHSKILFSSTEALVRWDKQANEPSYLHHICDLFIGLSSAPGTRKSRRLQQLREISKAMEQFIQEAGRAELDIAEGSHQDCFYCNRAAKAKEMSSVIPLRYTNLRPSKRVMHTFTYASVLPKRWRKAMARCKGGDRVKMTLMSRVKGFHTCHVGQKKRKVAFLCRGKCSLGKACLTDPSVVTPRRNLVRLARPVQVGDESEPSDLGSKTACDSNSDSDWESDSDPSDLEYFETASQLSGKTCCSG